MPAKLHPVRHERPCLAFRPQDISTLRETAMQAGVGPAVGTRRQWLCRACCVPWASGCAAAPQMDHHRLSRCTLAPCCRPLGRHGARANPWQASSCWGWSVRCSRKVATDNRSILPPCWRSKRCSRRWRTNGSARPLAAHLNALDPCRLRRLPCRKFAGTAFNFAYIAGRMAVKGLINLDVIVLPCHVLEGGLALPQQPSAAHLCHPCPAGMSVPWTADTHATA